MLLNGILSANAFANFPTELSRRTKKCLSRTKQLMLNKLYSSVKAYHNLHLTTPSSHLVNPVEALLMNLITAAKIIKKHQRKHNRVDGLPAVKTNSSF